MAPDTAGLTVLGATVRAPIEHVEVFPAPAHVTEVRLTSDEVTSLCPVTGQPDLSTIAVTYVPDEWCVETKQFLELCPPRDEAQIIENSSWSCVHGV